MSDRSNLKLLCQYLPLDIVLYRIRPFLTLWDRLCLPTKFEKKLINQLNYCRDKKQNYKIVRAISYINKIRSNGLTCLKNGKWKFSSNDFSSIILINRSNYSTFSYFYGEIILKVFKINNRTYLRDIIEKVMEQNSEILLQFAFCSSDVRQNIRMITKGYRCNVGGFDEYSSFFGPKQLFDFMSKFISQLQKHISMMS